ACDRIQKTLALMGYGSEKNMMFLLGHTGQSFRCFAEIKQGRKCEQAGYTLKTKVFENHRMEVFGGNFVKQKGIHGITFFCLQDKKAPNLCLLDTSQGRAFDMPESAFDTEDQEWAKK